jgi:Arc/MetJ-type ribon-helix-helix transcriptional regulator
LPRYLRLDRGRFVSPWTCPAGAAASDLAQSAEQVQAEGQDEHFREMIRAGVSSPDIVYAGAARKVSVSMPEDLTAAVQRRVGRGKFSQYVTEAVTRQLELDLLAELAELLVSEHEPVPEEDLAEARAAWPDDE